MQISNEKKPRISRTRGNRKEKNSLYLLILNHVVVKKIKKKGALGKKTNQCCLYNKGTFSQSESAMKRSSRIAAICIGMSVLFCSSITAGPRHGLMKVSGEGDYSCERRAKPPHVEMHEQHLEAVVEVLVELTEKQADVIENKLAYKPLWAVIDEFKVDFQTFQARLEEKHADLLSQAVNDGKLTQSQADKIKRYKENSSKVGPSPFVGKFGKRRRFHPCSPRDTGSKQEMMKSLKKNMHQAAIDEIVANTKAQENAVAEKLNYKPVWAVADEYGIDLQQFHTNMKERLQSFVDQAVADGTITEAQGMRIIKRMDRQSGFGWKDYRH